MNAATRLIDYAGEVPTGLAAQMTWWSPTDAGQFGVAALGLLLALLALPRVAVTVADTLRRLPRPYRRAVLVALGLALLVRLLVPARLVLLFSGYELVERSAVLTGVHRYGAGAQVLHRLLFLFLPPDHATLILLHRVTAWLALWPLLAWFARWRPPPRALVFAALGLALLPLLVRDAATESILVPGSLWLWSGLLLLDAPPDGQRAGDHWRAMVLVAAAALTRPELLIVAPVLGLLVVRRRGVRLTWPRAGLALLFLVLVSPQLWHTVERMLQDAAQGTNRLHKLFPLGPLAVVGSFLPFWPLAFPLAWTLLALRSLWRPTEQGAWRRQLAVATYLWVFALLVDLPQTSVPRLEAPLAALWLLLGAWQLAELPPLTQRWAGALVVLTTLPTLWLFAPTNEDDAEHFTRAALAQLPTEGACLVTLHESDPPDKGKVQRAFPDYLLRPPHRTAKRYAMAQWQEAGAPQCRAGTFLLIEHRCYAIFHHPVNAPALLPICTDTLAQHAWQPVLQTSAPNHGQNEYGWYPDVPAFQLGLYRMRP